MKKVSATGPVEALEEKIEEVVDEAVQKVDTVEKAIKKGVEDFITSHLRNSPFSRDTEAWNHFYAGIGTLVDNIVKEVKGL